MATSDLRSQQDWQTLCTKVKKHVPVSIDPKAWEVIIAAALIASPDHLLLGQFFTHLVQQDAFYSSEDEKRRLSLRFRDVLLKLIVLVGVPQVISNLAPLAKAEGEYVGKARESSLNEKWKNVDVPTIYARGEKTINTVYGPLLPKIFETWGDHTQDVQFNVMFSVYGLYLSDSEVLTALETEAVAFTTICCGGFKGPSLWHMRGMGRLLGARGTDEDTEDMRMIKDMLRSLKMAMMFVVEWVGEEYVRRADVGGWVNVGDVVRTLGGWGDDM